MEHVARLAVSIRLDDESQRALHALETTGLTRSEAIRKGLCLAAEQLGRLEMIRREAEMVTADQQDRREMLEIAAFMESLRAEG
ncbi:MAG TPA: hypothetical protein VNF08_09025 [Acidimicrobiales bacterium]|nr:hypothetical protein [Acidimicrobiales bacterium]